MIASRREAAAIAAVLVSLVAAISAGLLSGPDGGPLALAVVSLSTRAGDALEAIGRALPFGYAFTAGMAAAVNPCGFALLPAYLGLYLGTDGSTTKGLRPLGRALVVGATMTASFIALFGVAGLVLATAASVVLRLLPWASVLVGALLMVVGGRMLAGAAVYAGAAQRLGAHAGSLTHRGGPLGYAAYGLAFALTSLGCTLPLFLTVIGSALTVGGIAVGLLQFVLYGLGMGTVVTGATIVVALFGQALLTPARRVGQYLETASALLLLLTGAYLVYYWLAVGGLLA
jgi:cytochrome c biogenesis protein CcdA